MKVLTSLLLSLITLFIISISITGCSRDVIISSTNSGSLSNRIGVFVLAEGNSSANDNALSFLSFENGSFTYNITFPMNFGLHPEAINEHNNNFYVIEQGSEGGEGKIYKMDSSGFLLASYSFGINPFSLVCVNGKAYCTCGPDSSVRVIDLTTFTEIRRIKVGLFPQEITSFGTRVYVANTGIIKGGTDSTVSVIDGNMNEQIAKIDIGRTPSALQFTKDGNLLAASSVRGGIIYKISPFNNRKIDSISVGTTVISEICIDNNSDDIYFVSDNSSIVRVNLYTKVKTTVITSAASGLAYIYGYAYDWKNQKHYIADARDFAVKGVLNKFSSSGVLEATYQTGIRPRRIFIRN